VQETAPGFYGSYASYKNYQPPELGPKQRRRFDAEIWRPAGCDAAMRFLEIGCGTGAFLAYLAAKGVADFVGIDHDPALAEVIPANVRDRFRCGDLWRALESDAAGFGAIVVYGQRQGSRRRLVTDAILHRLLSWALLTPPELWTANFYAVLETRP